MRQFSMLMNTVQKSTDRRRHARAPVLLHGRFMLPDESEFACTSRDISISGIAVEARELPPIGTRVILYIDIIGRLDGIVVRHTKFGFAVSFTLPKVKVEKMADQLTWLLNREKLGMAEDRRHERIVPRNTRSTMTFADGTQLPCRIIDISISGAAANVDTKPPIGSVITVGQTPGRVMRSFDSGVAIEFFRSIPIEKFDENHIL